MRNFNILTLSSNNRLGDPVSVITGGVAFLTTAFPNIFGGSRKRLTDSDWLQLLPGNGYMTVRLRNYLKNYIHYDTDAKNIQPFSMNFMYENRKEICPEVPDSCWPFGDTGGCPQCVSKFSSILKQEQYTGGNQPFGQVPGGVGSYIDWSTVLPIALGGLVLIMALNKKKK